MKVYINSIYLFFTIVFERNNLYINTNYYFPKNELK